MARPRSEFLSAFGVAFEIFKKIADEVIELGGSDDDLRSLLNNKAKLRKVAEAIVGKGTVTASSYLCQYPYRVGMNRGPFPEMSILEERFSKGGVVKLFNGSYDWKKHPHIRVKNANADVVIMIIKEFSKEEVREIGEFDRENLIAWGLKNGLRAADEQETYAFGINPKTADCQRQNTLLGVGASAVDQGFEFVAMLSVSHGMRQLSAIRADMGCSTNCGYLFIFDE